jgi:hypothetical protein
LAARSTSRASDASVVDGPAAVTRNHERALAVDGACEDRVAGSLAQRPALSREQRFLDARCAVDHDAIGGNRRAGRNAHAIVDRELSRGDRLDGVAAQAVCGGGQLPHDAFDRSRRLRTRLKLRIARDQQQCHEHRHRVVVHLTAARDRRPRARRERAGHADCDRHVHPGRARTQSSPCTGEEGRSAVRHHGQRDEQARPIEQRLQRGLDRIVGEVHRDREHHHLHRREQGDAHAHEQRARFPPQERLAACRIVRIGTISDRRDVP